MWQIAPNLAIVKAAGLYELLGEDCHMTRLLSRRSIVLFAAYLVLTISIALPSLPANACNKSFRVYNDTDTAIEQLFVSPTSSSNWEDDVLGDNTIDSGANTVIDMSADQRDLKIYDVKAVFTNGAVIIGDKVPICSAVQVHIHASGVTYTTE